MAEHFDREAAPAADSAAGIQQSLPAALIAEMLERRRMREMEFGENMPADLCMF